MWVFPALESAVIVSTSGKRASSALTFSANVWGQGVADAGTIATTALSTIATTALSSAIETGSVTLVSTPRESKRAATQEIITTRAALR